MSDSSGRVLKYVSLYIRPSNEQACHVHCARRLALTGKRPTVVFTREAQLRRACCSHAAELIERCVLQKGRKGLDVTLCF